MGVELRKGCCLELMKDIPDKSIDMVLSDLPYGITKCKWDIRLPFDKLWEQYNRIIKDNGAVVLFGVEPFASMLRMSNIKNYKYDWIWNKVSATGYLNARRRPMPQTENILVFGSGRKSISYYPIMAERPKGKINFSYCGSPSVLYNNAKTERRLYTQYYPKNILTFSNANRKGKLHPTQKPVPLLEYLIKTYTRENETVLDNCMGSGSTAIACINLGRSFTGMELDGDCFNAAAERVKNCVKTAHP
jgi:site-specific DNA-methyltransferase (adenine-specific)